MLNTLLVFLFAFLFGCGGGPRDPSGRKVITLWAHEGQPAEKAALERIIADFNARQAEILVRAEFKQEQGYGDRINAAAVAGELPDVIDIDGPYTAHYADLGVLAGIGPYFDKAELGRFLPTLIAQGTFCDTLYTLGAFESTVVLYYHRPLLQKCGIRPPDSLDRAWTWPVFLDALRLLKKAHPGVLPLETFIPWGGEWLPYAFLPLVWSNGGRVISESGDTAQGCLNGPGAVSALSAWQALFQEGLSDKNAPPGQFMRGKAAMAWGIFNRWPLYDSAGLDFGMAPLPRFGTPCSPSGSWCWGITRKCRDKPAAAKVLKQLLHPKAGIAPICRVNGGIPAREDALEFMPEYVKTRGLFLAQLRRSARARPVTPFYGVLTKELSRALEDIARGAPVRAALDGVVKRYEASVFKR
jgi:ABC-type glycerol-3-phosphate transport system substrate-binding protein